ncbi:MAG: peptide-methionine (S)-S-oxide reductase MsrA [Verrucomicrobiae bacterium]|jgi:peptide-methionine (S)-S-oxide reductase|nr:peptide-methionine (S)-S-oxide reductase MsrA [Verrucomicrobiae bacterium]
MSEQQITLACGCFWCVEAVYQRVPGVLKVESGYANGLNDNPTYQQVCTGTTNHAEVIQITFDPERTKIETLLEVFWSVHDPTTLNRQGNDTGTQYRSGIYHTSDEQRQLAEQSKAAAQARFPNPIVTEIKPLEKYFPAEDYHQDYFNQNPGNGYCQLVIPPKLAKLEKLGLE